VRSRRPARTVVAVIAVALAGVVSGAIALDEARRDRAEALPSPPDSPPITASPSSPSHGEPRLRAPGPIPGYLLIADRGNDRMLLVDGNKHILWRYPRPGHPPSMPFNFDDDTFFTPGWRGVISNQEEQQTIEEISFPGGRVTWHYGHVDAAGSAPGLLHTPDDAYALPDGTVMVADVGNCRVLFISSGGRIERQIGTTGVCGHAPPRLLASPNGDTPLPNGGVLVTEIGGSWIDAIDPNGHVRWTVQAPVSYPSDAQPLGHGRILLADYARPGRILIMDRHGKVLWSYGPSSGPGMLDHPSLALPLPNGLIAVNDDYRDRVVLIDRSRHRIVWQYGHTDVSGRAAGYLNTPDGMDFLPLGVASRMPAIRRLVRTGA
jgi:hypothetical protein